MLKSSLILTANIFAGIRVFKAIATDVDGTLTLRRGDVRLSQHALRGVREAERAGISVIIVSGNSLPVTAGLRTYLGASGPAVAENGCIVFYRGKVTHVCTRRVPEELVDRVKGMGLIESWQNPYREHDVAFYVPRGLGSPESIINEVARLASSYGVKVLWSGYALHLNTGSGKASGVLRALEMLGVSRSELAAIGDGENDLDMLAIAAFSGAPGDAADVVKRSVNYVASRPGGAGFLEFVREVIRRSTKA
ncbi:MAG: phosphoglycolate phosphatase [Acidilobus sp.]